MSLRYGNAYLALGWLIAACLWLSPALAQNDKHSVGGPVQSQPEAKQEPPQPSAAPTVGAYSAHPKSDPQSHQNPCNDPKYGRKSDLCQQWRMAEAAEETATWTLGQIIATGIEGGLLAIAIFVAGVAAYWAKRAAEAGDETVNVAREATEDARISAERQLRAYVCVSGVQLKFAPLRVRATVVAKNAGATPAYKFRTQGGFKLCDFPPDIPIFGWNESAEDTSVGIIGPGDDSDNPYAILITDEQVTQLRTGKMALYVFGEYRYKDAFKHDRFTKYRFMVGGDAGFNADAMSPCKEGNDAN